MDKLNKYLHRLISNNRGTVTYSKKSTYYNICGRVIRVSDHIGRKSNGSISIIYDASGSNAYIIHAHGSGMISIVDYENVKKIVKSFTLLPAMIGIFSCSNNIDQQKIIANNTVLGYNINEFGKKQQNSIFEFVKQIKTSKNKNKL